MNINDFTDWSTLLTYGGACIATAVFTQMLKGVFNKLPTRFFSYAVAAVLLIAATFFTGSRCVGDYVLCTVNAALVSLSANGSFDLLKSFQRDTVSMDILDSEDDDRENYS